MTLGAYREPRRAARRIDLAERRRRELRDVRHPWRPDLHVERVLICPSGIHVVTTLPAGEEPASRLPVAQAAADVVASALVINFIADRRRALSEMRRVTRIHGVVAGYIWDFREGLSPSGPFRVGMREVVADLPARPGYRALEPRRASLVVRAQRS